VASPQDPFSLHPSTKVEDAEDCLPIKSGRSQPLDEPLPGVNLAEADEGLDGRCGVMVSLDSVDDGAFTYEYADEGLHDRCGNSASLPPETSSSKVEDLDEGLLEDDIAPPTEEAPQACDHAEVNGGLRAC
jgi:hypothetical protein